MFARKAGVCLSVCTLLVCFPMLMGCGKPEAVAPTKDETAQFLKDNPEYAKPQEMIDSTKVPGL